LDTAVSTKAVPSTNSATARDSKSKAPGTVACARSEAMKAA
jgi:hypothetical protein